MTGLLYQQGAPRLTPATPDSSAARTPPEVACAMQRLLAGKGIVYVGFASVASILFLRKLIRNKDVPADDCRSRWGLRSRRSTNAHLDETSCERWRRVC